MITNPSEDLPLALPRYRPAGRVGPKWLRNHVRLIGAIVAFALALAAGPAIRANEIPKAYAYVGAPYVITAEPAGAHQFVLNFFNLSDYVIVLQPSEFIYKGASGEFYIGQVFDLPTKTTRGDSYRYSASFLLSGNSFKGLNVIGAFHEQDHIDEISVRIGAKRFYMEPLDKSQYDQLGAKIGDLEMKHSDPQAALRKANLLDMGRVTTTDGTAEWDRDWQGLLSADDLNPPRIAERPEVMPTDDARRTNTYGNVKLAATITRDGTIQNLTVAKGLGHGLDERAVEAVKASWVFLPATKNGEVVETDIKFDVPFAPPKK